MSLDLKDHFLASAMLNVEYMRLTEKYLPSDIIPRYQLQNKLHKGYVYCKINKGMYGLKQAGLLWHEMYVAFILALGFVQCAADPCIFFHPTKVAVM